MRSGKLRDRLEIMSKELDENGTAVYTSLATVSAQIIPLSGKEQLYASQNQASTTHRVLMRYIAGITPDMSLVYTGRTGESGVTERWFAIDSVIDKQNRHRELELLCSEVLT